MDFCDRNNRLSSDLNLNILPSITVRIKGVNSKSSNPMYHKKNSVFWIPACARMTKILSPFNVLKYFLRIHGSVLFWDSKKPFPVFPLR